MLLTSLQHRGWKICSPRLYGLRSQALDGEVREWCEGKEMNQNRGAGVGCALITRGVVAFGELGRFRACGAWGRPMVEMLEGSRKEPWQARNWRCGCRLVFFKWWPRLGKDPLSLPLITRRQRGKGDAIVFFDQRVVVVLGWSTRWFGGFSN
jgi:hypothetical protein